MKIIPAQKVSETIKELCLEANLRLRKDVLLSLKTAYARETNKRAAGILKVILENADTARKEDLAICQDTGLPCVFVELGQDVSVKGDLKQAIQKGVARGYQKGSFRNSIVADPLARGVSGYAPAMIHIDVVKGNKLKLTVMPKGFGCENKTKLKMFNPTAGIEEIKSFIVEAVKSAGPDACPPYVVGVGIGGSADYACLLAKKALLKRVSGIAKKYGVTNIVKNYDVTKSPFDSLGSTTLITSHSLRAGKGTSYVPKLEEELLREMNKLGIGPMGLGGKTTVLGVNIETSPTHIAGLPVCVNISCHALRSAEKIL